MPSEPKISPLKNVLTPPQTSLLHVARLTCLLLRRCYTYTRCPGMQPRETRGPTNIGVVGPLRASLAFRQRFVLPGCALRLLSTARVGFAPAALF